MIPINIEITKEYKEFYAKSLIDYIENRSNKYSVNTINNCIASVFNGIISNIKELLLANPSILIKLVEVYNLQSSANQARINEELDLERMYDVFCSGELSYEHSTYGKLNSEQHHKFLNFEVCPYCNQNPVASIKKSKTVSKPRRTYDWDHFFPKSKYKFLNVSLFNLVPSCKTCNSFKNDSVTSYLSPFEKYKVNQLVEFYVEAGSIKYLESSNNFVIKKELNLTNPLCQKMNNLLNDIHILERYSEHKSFLRIQFKKYRKYNSSSIKSLRKLVSLFDKDNEKKSFENYFGIPIDENEFKNIPYSKLLHDVFYKNNIYKD